MAHKQLFKLFKLITVCSALLLFGAMFGCSDGTNGTSSGTITSSKVVDTGNNKLSGINVTATVGNFSATTTTANGAYSLTVPAGVLTVTFSKAGYTTVTATNVSVGAGQSTTLDETMTQTAAAVVNVSNANFVNGTATLTATVLVNDPSLQGQAATFQWTDSAGNVLGSGPSITVSQPSTASFKAAVANKVKVRMGLDTTSAAAIELTDENDVDVPSFQPLDRFQVLAIPQKAFEDAANTPYTVTATIGGKIFSSTPTVSVPTNKLTFVPNNGLRNVPVGQPVVLQGFLNVRPLAATPVLQTTFSWTITAAPTGSTAALVDPTTRFPHFIPDLPGKYTVTETGSGTTNTINIYAGTYVGILLPNGSDPHGTIDTGCTTSSCHPGSTFFNTPYSNGAQFFDTTPIVTVFSDWQKSGHSQIMVKGMQEGVHYDINSCGKCHSVGYAQYSSAIKAGGFKDVINASKFTNATFLANAPNFFNNFPQVLKVSEVQCETCHGPNTSGAHATSLGAVNADALSSRFSVAADVCGTCHGEPLRHGRFQEWAESGHGDYETAMHEGLNGASGVNSSCGGCHSGQGFPLFVAQLQGGNPLRTLNAANVTALAFLTPDNVQPQTCSSCHQVHNPGTQPGLVGNVVILRGDYQAGGAFAGTTPLLPSGFQANGVGEGALCITCHNSRNGGSGTTALLHEDGGTVAGNFATLAAYSAPHEACQSDVLMGRNAYFFSGAEDTHNGLVAFPAQVGARGPHSILSDACVTCHLQKAPPDPALGYPANISGAGTNHTFAIVSDVNTPADTQINALCVQCHGSSFVGTGIQQSFTSSYNQLLIATANAIKRIHGDPAATKLVFIPGRTPQISLNGAVPVSLATYLANAPGTARTGVIPASGFQLDLAKANWNACLVAPSYSATFGGTSFDNGTPILDATGASVSTAGDNSESVHNPSFVNKVITTTLSRINSL